MKKCVPSLNNHRVETGLACIRSAKGHAYLNQNQVDSLLLNYLVVLVVLGIGVVLIFHNKQHNVKVVANLITAPESAAAAAPFRA